MTWKPLKTMPRPDDPRLDRGLPPRLEDAGQTFVSAVARHLADPTSATLRADALEARREFEAAVAEWQAES